MIKVNYNHGFKLMSYNEIFKDMEKSLEQQIKEQEVVVAKKAAIKDNVAVYSVDAIIKDAEYKSALIKLLELKLQLAESKRSESLTEYQKQVKGQIEALQEEIRSGDAVIAQYRKVLSEIPDCTTHGDQCVPHAIDWVKMAKEKLANTCPPQPPKEKTLEEYYKEYKRSRHQIAIIGIPICELGFEICCGLLKYICEQVDKEFSKSESRWNISLCKYGYDVVGSAFHHPFFTHNPYATNKVISICGTEFLDKIFKA